MTDKIQKIKDWISKTQDGLMDVNGNFENSSNEGAFHILSNLDYYIDSLQEEPVSKTPADVESAMQEVEEKSRVFTEAHKGEDTNTILAQMRGEEPVSEDLEEASKKWLRPQLDKSYAKYGETKMMELTHFDGYAMLDAIEFGAEWQKTKDESTTEGLGEYINELSKQFPEVSFAKLSRIAVRVAKWHNEHLWKHADGNNLPIIDREVIALLDNGKVVFAHRPPEFWDGKNIITGKVTRNYPKTYDKGGWNIPNIIYWLDVELPKEIEL